MKKLLTILLTLSFVTLLVLQLGCKREVSKEIALEQVQMYEISDATADIQEVDKELLKEYQIIELESGEIHVFNMYGAYKVTDILYLKEELFKDSSEMHECNKLSYESSSEPEWLYEQFNGLIHYCKEFSNGDIYHKVVFYDSSYRILPD